MFYWCSIKKYKLSFSRNRFADAQKNYIFCRDFRKSENRTVCGFFSHKILAKDRKKVLNSNSNINNCFGGI